MSQAEVCPLLYALVERAGIGMEIDALSGSCLLDNKTRVSAVLFIAKEFVLSMQDFARKATSDIFDEYIERRVTEMQCHHNELTEFLTLMNDEVRHIAKILETSEDLYFDDLYQLGYTVARLGRFCIEVGALTFDEYKLTVEMFVMVELKRMKKEERFN
jgi:hypothetical protein